MKFNEETVLELIENDILYPPMDGNHGNIHPKGNDFVDEGIPFIMASDIESGNINFESCKYITIEQAKTLKKGFAKAGDVLLTHKATIGRTAIVPETKHPYIMLSPQVTYYRIKNESVLKPAYLEMYFNSYYFQNILKNWAGSGSTRAYLGILAQRKLPIRIVSIKIQQQIVNSIRPLKLKIEYNKQIISNLEEFAQALFKRWFVDFEFPNEEGKPYKSSGGKIVESELGMIPEGWDVTNIQSMPVIISDHVANGSFASLKKNVQIVEEKDYALFLRNTDLKQDLQGERRYVTKSSYELLKKTQLFGGEVIISNVGDVGTIHRCPSLKRPMVLGNNLIVIQPTEQNETLNTYFYFLFKSYEGKRLINSITSGSVQMKFNKTDFRNLKIAIPEDFEKMNVNILNKILLKVDLLKQEIEDLSKLRDSILPKLLSGEIELPDDMEVTDDVPIS